MALLEELRARLTPHNQQHLLAFWSRLSESQRGELARHVHDLDVSRLSEMRAAIELLKKPAVRELSVAPVVELADRNFPYALGAEAQAARGEGDRALRAGQVACLLVAGGQGTRLGFAGPKGCYPLMPLSQMTLFEVFARKLLRAGRQFGRVPPLYVMVSSQNEQQTREFFAAHRGWGLDASRVHFFAQGEMPSLDAQGRLVLEDPGSLFMGPDGHGGVLAALHKSGCLEEMSRAGISTISYFQVDNAQVPVADAAFIGLHLTRQADVSLKVVRKEDPAERVGFYCADHGVPQIVEYSEFSVAQSAQRSTDGGLAYWAGSIAVHAFSVAFLHDLAKRGIDLPLHAAHKKVATLNEAGELQEPAAPNVYRFERFIFDTLPLASRVAALEVPREEQFLPLKNADGPFGPEGVRESMQQYWRRALAHAGLPTSPDAPPVIEVDPGLCENARELIEYLRKPGTRPINLAGPVHLHER
ncbi:MAG: UDPGP type 1 family protein [Planctomycetes bacterium]|nr:UDPGP type 1 family protein [Planctomycetota bacterium]